MFLTPSWYWILNKLKVSRQFVTRLHSFLSCASTGCLVLKWVITWSTDTRWGHFILIISQMFGSIWADQPKKVLRYLWYFGSTIEYPHFPYLVHDFSLIRHFFYKKLSFSYSLQKYLFRFGVWVLAVKTLCICSPWSSVFFFSYCLWSESLLTNK